MNEAITIALSFPTLPITVLLAFVVIYWLLAATGLFDIDAVEGWVDLDVGDLVEATDSSVTPSGFAGVLARLGLSGVPFMVSITLVILFAWLASCYLHLFLLSPMTAGFGFLLGLAVLAGSLVIAILATALALKPIRWILSKLIVNDEGPSTLLGKEGIVSSPVVNSNGGRVEVNDGGAGLILQAKSLTDVVYERGAAVVVVSHDKQNHVYEIISKEEFYMHK
jgi:membrane protein implicated in regulation of membrane protease activity